MPEFSDEDAKRIIRNATSILNREVGENPYLLHEDLQKNTFESNEIAELILD